MSIRKAIADANPWYVIAGLVVLIIAMSVTWRTYSTGEPTVSFPAIEQAE